MESNFDFFEPTPKDERIDYKPLVRMRNRALFCYRLLQGLLQFWYRAWVAFPVLLIWFLCSLILSDAVSTLIEYGVETSQLAPLVLGFESTVGNIAEVHINAPKALLIIGRGIAWGVIVWILLCLLRWLGKPYKADVIESYVRNALSIPDRFNFRCPFLISAMPAWWRDKTVTNKFITVYVFWSGFIPLKKWQNADFLETFCASLNVELCEEPTEGGRRGRNSRLIILRVIPRDKINDDNAVAVDPLFE
jgi:hypothetical protein